MVLDGIDEQTALEAIKEKRKEKLGQVSQQEAQALISMANDGVDINDAMSAVSGKGGGLADVLGKLFGK